MAQYKRVLLKLSGESLAAGSKQGIDTTRLHDYASQIIEISDMGVEVAIVVGGGNIFRGMAGSAEGLDRVSGDRMGMLATVINALAISAAINAQCPAIQGTPRAVVMTSTPMEPYARYYDALTARQLLAQGHIVFIAGGTGNPFFTTDSASALRGIELQADIMLKGPRVDGIYTADPERDPTAIKLSRLTYQEVYDRGLRIMDLTAMTLCQENHLPIIVFDMDTTGNLARVMRGEEIGSIVS